MGKLGNVRWLPPPTPPPAASPPPIEKKVSCGEVAGLNFPTTYTDEGLVGKLPETSADYLLQTSPPPIGEARLNFPTTYTDEGVVGKLS